MRFIIMAMEYENRESFKKALIILLENAHPQEHA